MTENHPPQSVEPIKESSASSSKATNDRVELIVGILVGLAMIGVWLFYLLSNSG